MPGTKQKLQNTLIIFWITGNTLIGFGCFQLHQLGLCLFNRRHYWRATTVILIDPDTQINFGGAGIRPECSHQS